MVFPEVTSPESCSPEIASPVPDLIIPPELFVIVNESILSFRLIAFEPAALIVPELVTVSLVASAPCTALFKLKIVPPDFTVTELSDQHLCGLYFCVASVPRVTPELIVSVDSSVNLT